MRCAVVAIICALVTFVIGALCLGVGLLLYGEFDNFFGSTVRQQMAIDDQVLWWYDNWLHPPARETLTVHVFEVENADELRRSLGLASPASQSVPGSGTRPRPVSTLGATGKIRPQLREIGPFVFRVERIKERVNYVNVDKRQISYEERTEYHFDPLLSYEDLDQRVTVVNSELAALSPFVQTVVGRAQRASRLSKSLGSAINEILQLYTLNQFVERPIWRVLFGPNYLKGMTEDGQELPTAPPSEENEVEGIPYNGNETTEFTVLVSANITSRFDVKEITDDPAILRILRIYDQVGEYMNRLNIDIDPYSLLQGFYKYQERKRLIIKKRKNKSNDLLKQKLGIEEGDDDIYRTNSVMAFFANNSIEKYDIYTGVETKSNSKIIRWNNQNMMDAWFGRSCNMINGTDGRQYPPFLRRRRIYEFIPRICRSVPLYISELSLTSQHGVTMRRYVKASDFLQSPYRNRGNACFCRYVNQTRRCNFDGILDLSNCYSGAPVILSSPHFSGRITKSIAREIAGLTPDESIYQTYLDLEPVSGIVLDKNNRFQFNIHLSATPVQLNTNRSLQELIVPLFWYQEQWIASPDYQNHIKYFFIYPLKYQELGIYALIIVGIGFLGLSFLCLICCCCGGNAKKKLENKTSKAKVSATGNRDGAAYSGTGSGEPILEPVQYNYKKQMQEGDYVEYGQPGEHNYYDNQNYVDDPPPPMPVASERMMMAPPGVDPSGLPMMTPQAPQYPLKRLKQSNPPMPPVNTSRLPYHRGNQQMSDEYEYEMYNGTGQQPTPYDETQMPGGEMNPEWNGYEVEQYYEETGSNDVVEMDPRTGKPMIYNNNGYAGQLPLQQQQQMQLQQQRAPSFLNQLPPRSHPMQVTPPPFTNGNQNRNSRLPPPPPGMVYTESDYEESYDQTSTVEPSRADLMSEIRQGTHLRKTHSGNEENVGVGPRRMESNVVINIAAENQFGREYRSLMQYQGASSLVDSGAQWQSPPRAWFPALSMPPMAPTYQTPPQTILAIIQIPNINNTLPVPHQEDYLLQNFFYNLNLLRQQQQTGTNMITELNEEIFGPRKELLPAHQNFRFNSTRALPLPRSISDQSLDRTMAQMEDETNDEFTQRQLEQAHKLESIRFYGPYRAYKHQMLSQDTVLSTPDTVWDTSDEDEEEEENNEMLIKFN